jgi:hypothetical protein
MMSTGQNQGPHTVGDSNKYQDISLLNHDRPAMVHRWEPVDLVAAFCYGSLEPKPRKKAIVDR